MKSFIKGELIKYSVFPSVVAADKESEITITSQDDRMLFFDDVTYDVVFIPFDTSDVPHDEKMTLKGYEKGRKVYKYKPQNGILKIKHTFCGEQKWTIHISTKEYGNHSKEIYDKAYPTLEVYRKVPEYGAYLEIYSLGKDLYQKRVLRADLHIHTSETDACESPQLTATEFRRAGYDVIALTEHNIYDVGSLARKEIDFKTDFKILCAEEIHNNFGGHIHILNIGGKKSINDMYLKTPEYVKQEVEKLAKTSEIPDWMGKDEYLNRLFICNEVRKNGGVVIYPHPCWNICHRSHVGDKAALGILKNDLCDAFELIGGNYPPENNMQLNLYEELLRSGCDIPVTASTDSHTVFSDKIFCSSSSLLFVENDDILSALKEGNSVAVEHTKGETTRYYGPLRLVRYAKFLTENYFPVHNRLCESSGQVMTDYVLGEKDLFDIAERLEKRVTDFEDKFFGKK